MAYEDWEIVMGLEVHSELKTKTKIYCSCSTEFGADVNTHVCPVCLGLPGALPVLNKKVVEFAIRAGLAMNCSIQEFSKQDRKNYFYPDLPKAYQISQFDLPLCYEGFVEIETEELGKKKIGIERIHIEEDAGKLLHEATSGTLVDYNRGGVPLIEIVSKPDFRSIEEARVYLENLKTILKYIDVSDCKMEEGSLRSDINISVRKKGDTKFGTRTELKNMNSFTHAIKAIEYEYKRQIDVLENGGTITQETRRWNEDKQITESLRSKEEAHDYRYFPEPDLLPIITPKEVVEEIAKTIPELPQKKKERYQADFGLTAYDADLIANYKNVAKFYEEACKYGKDTKNIANTIISEIYKKIDTEEEKEAFEVPFEAKDLGDLDSLIASGVIGKNIAKKVLEEMWETGKKPNEIVEEQGLKQIDNDDELKAVVLKVLENDAQSVADYKAGKERALKALMGGIMKETKGKANPEKVQALLLEELSK
ncbi:MAG: Asp-tRNA(Asn)/Glu-tRNA(Gln) amidotransferase subunit GatB [Clostridia bacterium]|nr:Asp-tRNA(Asn)/Glu-tRNA(Gln) amidotransferase subunit GatB [Clostridia bacterium]